MTCHQPFRAACSNARRDEDTNQIAQPQACAQLKALLLVRHRLLLRDSEGRALEDASMLSCLPPGEI